MGNIFCDKSSVIYPTVEFDGSAWVGPHCVIGGFCFQHADWSPTDFAHRTPVSTTIGTGTRILGHTIICSGTSVGMRMRADYHCFVGEDCRIADDCVIEYGARVYTGVRIGAATTVSGFVCNQAIIGNACVIQGSLIHARTRPGPEPAPTVEDNCLIGMGALVIGGITIRRGSVIGAGAVVTKDTDEGYLYIGAPARKIRKQIWF